MSKWKLIEVAADNQDPDALMDAELVAIGASLKGVVDAGQLDGTVFASAQEKLGAAIAKANKNMGGA